VLDGNLDESNVKCLENILLLNPKKKKKRKPPVAPQGFPFPWPVGGAWKGNVPPAVNPTFPMDKICRDDIWKRTIGWVIGKIVGKKNSEIETLNDQFGGITNSSLRFNFVRVHLRTYVSVSPG